MLRATMSLGPALSTPLASDLSTGVHVTEDVFGKLGDTTIKRFALTNANQLSVHVLTYGAIISSIYFPDKHGKAEDVVLGFDTVQGYLNPDNPYFGAIVGRVANRIANASFDLDGKEYKLNANEGHNTLHGGIKGFDKAIWTPSLHPDGVTLSLVSPDGEEGFPGTVTAQVTYRLTADDRLLIDIQAVTTKPTPVNIINHSYFNLAGHCAGSRGVYDTRISINADRYTPADPATNVPTGEFASVDGTPLDLRTTRLMGELLPNFNYDHNMVISKPSERSKDIAFVARASHENSGRSIELYSDQPGMQFYTSNGLPEKGSTKTLPGKNGAEYVKHGAFCFESQNFPDAIHKMGKFPDSVLRPGTLYKHHMIFKFFVQ